jgi:hypothetical protein
MGEPTITTLKVSYQENGAQKSRNIKFKGNFGFSLDGSIYTVKDGKVLDPKGKAVTELNDLARGLAYQLIGMSCTAESARDYTYSEKDMKAAASFDDNEKLNSQTPLDRQAAATIGTGAGSLVEAFYNDDDGKYTTWYKNKDINFTTEVSIWQIK